MKQSKQKNKQHIIIRWKCKICGDVVESNNKQSHNMDYCKCKKSAVDAEDFYMRTIGEVEILKNE